nr:hypothetical protein [Clostridia bacterium]
MKERIERYIRKKKREKALKLVKDNIFVILGALGILILLIILKALKRKAKKKVKAKIKSAVKEKVGSMRNKDDSSDGKETETEE